MKSCTYHYHAGVDGVTAATRLVAGLNLPNTSFITNFYDSLAREIETTLKNSGGTAVNWHTYTYNAGNQRSQMIAYPANRKVDYTYDGGGQLLKADGKESGGTSRPH